MRQYLLWLWLLSLSWALAQPFPTLEGAVATDSSRLDREAVNGAAEALAARGLSPFVLFIEGDVGDSLAEAEAYFDRALEHYGLTRNGVREPGMLALFVGTRALPDDEDQRPLYLDYGSRLAPMLEASSGGGTVADAIRTEVMVPLLLAGNFTSAFTDALGAVAARLDTPVTTPAQTTVPVTPPSPQSTSDEPGLLGGSPWLWLFLVGVGAVMVVGVVRQRLGSAQGRREHRRDLEALKSQLSQGLIDFSSPEATSYLPDDPEGQTDMALLAGLLKDDAPDELASWRQRYGEAVRARQGLEERFSSLQKEPETDPEALIPEYQDLLEESRTIGAFVAELSGRFGELQGQLERLPERLAGIEAGLNDLRGSYPATIPADWPSAEALLAPLQRTFAALHGAQREGAQLRTLRLAESLEADLENVRGDLGRLLAERERLERFEGDLSRSREQGFHLSDLWQGLADARRHLAIALGLLSQGDYRVVDAQIEEVAERGQHLGIRAQRLSALHAENEERLRELAARGETLRAHIEQAATAFEALADFAPANWRDIRGNGTEAQKAAERAHALWKQAKEANQLSGAQQFEAAERALAAAQAELGQADTLAQSVETRLENLRQAQGTAQSELGQVEAELRAHRELLSRPEVDQEVGALPEGKLSEAERLVERIRGELAKDKPDWLTVMEHVQAADRLGDEAVREIRSEQEKMAQRRRLLASERTEAETSLSRLSRFAQVHLQDLGSSVRAGLEQAQDAFREAERRKDEAETLTEAELARTLEEAALGFDRAQRLADEAFVVAERDFNEMEALRTQAAEAAAKANASFESLGRYLARHNLGNLLGRSLQALAGSLPSYDERLGRDALGHLVTQANEADAAIARFYQEARNQVEAQESALRQERLRQLELTRRRQAAESARQSSSWGSWPSGGASFPSPRAPSRSIPRPTRSPMRSRPVGGGRSGGGWGGSSRKSGGGW